MSNIKSYWNSVYTETPFAAGKEPSSLLKQMLPRLQTGKVLDIAMGEGANAVYLAQNGFRVKGFDISDVALQHCYDLAKERDVTVETQCADLDLFLLGLMEYDSIIMMNFKPATKRYYSELVRALKQGGTLLIEGELSQNFSEKDLVNKDAPKSYFHPNEILQSLKDLLILFYQEYEVDGRHLVQCLATKPLDKDAAKYKLFDMHSEQKPKAKSSHEAALESLFKK